MVMTHAEVLAPPLSLEAIETVQRLLSPDPGARPGSAAFGDLQRLRFFASVAWEGMLSLAPPFVPLLESEVDDSYFEPEAAVGRGPELFSLSTPIADAVAGAGAGTHGRLLEPPLETETGRAQEGCGRGGCGGMATSRATGDASRSTELGGGSGGGATGAENREPVAEGVGSSGAGALVEAPSAARAERSTTKPAIVAVMASPRVNVDQLVELTKACALVGSPLGRRAGAMTEKSCSSSSRADQSNKQARRSSVP